MLYTATFDALLEDYVFSVANAVIDQVDADTQTHLIQFIYALNPGKPGHSTTAGAAPACVANFAPSRLTCSAPDWVDTPSPLAEPTVLAIRRSQQVHRERLTDLAQQLAQVKAKLAKTQAKVQERIQQNKALRLRFETYALAQK